MGKEYASNSKAIEKTKAEIEKYSNTTGLTEKQMESYAKKLEAAKSKLSAFEKAQEANTKEVESARKVIVDYEKVLNKKSERLNAARAKMREYAKAIAETTKRAEEGKKKLKEWGEAAEKGMDSVVKRTAQAAVAIGTVVGGFAVKTGFGEAMNLEGYKMQLETAVKDTEKAGKLMSNAIKFANSTPFETGEVVEATAKMEAYGISSERWLKDVADMAGATNKSIDQATEAMADAVMGEWERLKEFGIKKEQLVAAAAQKYGKNIVFNKKGQVIAEEKMQTVLQEVMQKKFAGGAEKQAKTAKGLWSTVTGVTKSSLAKIVGMTDEGTIRQGSLYEKLKTQIERVVNVLNKWQEDGTIDAIAEKVTAAVDNMITFFSNLFNFIKEHRVLIETVLVFVGSIYLTVKAIAALKIALTAVSVVMGLLNGTIALTPLGWIVIAIAGVVTACYLLWQHLDAVINVFKSVFNWIKNILDMLGPFGFAFAALTGPIGLVVTAVLGLIQHFDKLKAGAEKVWGFVKRIFGAEDTEIKATTEENSNSKITEEQIQNIKNDAPKGIGATKLPEIKNENKKSDPYFGEDKKYTQSKEASKKQETKIEVIIQGDVYGMDDFNEKVADAVVKMVEQNKANVVR
ncbi:MAG: hypothetical protein ACRC1R_00540 [Cetobacterium sp.]|uniref:hypothetical protein n=1 Tax=Cetobacterium sp. TaxID=2071632 RepID=UPI003F3E618E